MPEPIPADPAQRPHRSADLLGRPTRQIHCRCTTGPVQLRVPPIAGSAAVT